MSDIPFLDDPNGDAKQVSARAIDVLSNKVFGSILGPVIDTQLLSWLGLGSTDVHLEKYLQQIQASISELRDKVTQLQSSINVVINGITLIQISIPGVEVQQMLSSFAATSSFIKQNFQSYVDAINALQTADSKLVSEAANDLFQILSFNNMQQVASSLTVIQQLFLPTLVEQKGIIELQHDVVRSVIVDFASNPGNFKIDWDSLFAQTGPFGKPQPFPQVPSGNGLYSSDQILIQGQARASQCLRTSVADTFKAFITVQIQGLILLRLAWIGSIHESQIVQQVNSIRQVLESMKDFEAAVVKTVDDQIAASLHTSGQRLTGLAASNEIRYDYGGGDVRMQYPLNDDYLMWNVGPGAMDGCTTLIMLYQPWTYGRFRHVELTCSILNPDEPHIQIFGLDPVKPGSVPYLSYSQIDRYSGIPSELQFIRFDSHSLPDTP